jgi:hypothetical protein
LVERLGGGGVESGARPLLNDALPKIGQRICPELGVNKA